MSIISEERSNEQFLSVWEHSSLCTVPEAEQTWGHCPSCEVFERLVPRGIAARTRPLGVAARLTVIFPGETCSKLPDCAGEWYFYVSIDVKWA